MDNCKCLLFSMSLVGALASGCGLEAGDPGEAQLRAAERRGFVQSSASAMEGADCDASTASIRIMTRDGTLSGVEPQSEKRWTCSPFRFKIESLPTGRVAWIDSAIWLSSPDGIGTGNLRLTIATADLDAWEDWHKSFVIDGKRSDSNKKTATLTLLGPDLNEELMTINFEHVGIISLEKSAPPKQAPSQEVARFTVELYSEKMTIDSYDF